MTATKRALRVFLCHAHSDKTAVRELYLRLIQDGVDAWLDKANLIAGQDWEREIHNAVRGSDVVIVCLSKEFNQAGFRQKEVRLALQTAMEQPEGEIFIIPARLEECDTLDSLKKWHWVDLFEPDGYERLMLALRARADRIGVRLQPQARDDLGTSTMNFFPRSAQITPQPAQRSSSETPPRSRTMGHDFSRASAFDSDDQSPAGLVRTIKKLPFKSSLSRERVLEAAIEREVRLGRPASLFVWIRRHESKNIISVVSTIDDFVRLDEDNVKTKALEIEFPVVNGQAGPAEVSLRLVAHEFDPPIQQKQIRIPPTGDSEVCTFIIVPMHTGELLLSLEVLRGEVSLANRTLRTLAVEMARKADSPLVLVTIPMVVLVAGLARERTERPATEKASDNRPGRKARLEADKITKEEVDLLAKLKAEEDRLAGAKLEVEKKAREEYVRPMAKKPNVIQKAQPSISVPPANQSVSTPKNTQSIRRNRFNIVGWLFVASLILILVCTVLWFIMNGAQW